MDISQKKVDECLQIINITRLDSETVKSLISLIVFCLYNIHVYGMLHMIGLTHLRHLCILELMRHYYNQLALVPILTNGCLGEVKKYTTVKRGKDGNLIQDLRKLNRTSIEILLCVFVPNCDQTWVQRFRL